MGTLAESLALQAIKLYAGGLTYGQVSKELQISKGRVADLVREGISGIINNDGSTKAGSVGQPNDDQEKERVRTGENPGIHQGLVETNQFNYPLDPRMGSYRLETDGIGRRISLTPKAIMIYDLWRGSGFTGDLSDFVEDSINFMYESRRPRERFEIR